MRLDYAGIPWADRSTCPECGRDLVERRNRKKGNRFIGCTGYPNYCRYTRSWTRRNWKEAPDTSNADWRVNERHKANRLKKAGDIHCPRCDVGLLKIKDQAVECNRAICEYKEDYANG